MRIPALATLVLLASPAWAQTEAPADPPAGSALKMFRDRNFNGPALQLDRANSNMNFSPRSAMVADKAWEVCARPFFGGRCQTIEGRAAKLNLHRNFNGMVQSARPVAKPRAGQTEKPS